MTEKRSDLAEPSGYGQEPDRGNTWLPVVLGVVLTLGTVALLLGMAVLKSS